MPWKPLPSVAFAICTYPFQATDSDDLPLQIGDHIYIIEQGGQTSEWYRGYLVASPSLVAGLTSDRGQQLEHRVFSGIFPVNCVQVREFLGERPIQLQSDGANEEDADVGEKQGDISKARRKSMAARKASRRLSRKSVRSINKKAQSMLVPTEPMPRDPTAPKPLAPVPLLRVGDETGLSAAEPLVDEIASCLREWHDAQLHGTLLARGYTDLAKVANLIKRIDNSRNQLMHDVLTKKELADLREDTVWDLVAGNKMLSDEVIVRSPVEKGRLLTADDSVVEMTKLQANMSILDRPPNVVSEKHTLHHILVDVRNLVCDSEQPATLQLSLYSKEYGEAPKPLSENYAISIPVPPAQLLPPEEQTKTLFVNLSNLDAGVGSDMTSLVVVFKLLRDEPVRHMVHGQGMSHQQQKPSQANNPPANDRLGAIKGRRSVFGSQRRKENHSRNPSEMSHRPGTSLSQRSDTDARSSNSDAPTSRELRMVRRIVGVGALDVTSLIQDRTSLERNITLWTPCSLADDKSDENDDWVEMIRELHKSSTGGYSPLRLIQRFDVHVQPFAATNLESLVRSKPTIFHDVFMTPKLGFSGVPSEKRSDIYLTLNEALLARTATLAHSKFGAVPLSQRCQTSLANLQLTLEVRKASGERIDDCIFTAANHQGHTAWRTVGVERGEGWTQTIRLAIPAEEVPGSHIVMSIADSPNFPFALAWVPLWEMGAFVRDGEHQVALYVYDEYSSSIIGGKGAYLALPPWQNKSDQAQANGATISLRTFLCSTEYSQDSTLLGVLHWRNYHGEQLLELLQRFPFVPEIEVVKLLSDVFSALFEILHEYETLEEYEDVVFYNLVVVLGIAKDKRFDLGRVIEDYATTRHDWPNASSCLVKAYQRLVSSPLDPDASRKLRATLKVSDQMLKLIVETTTQHLADGATNGTEMPDRSLELNQELQKLFVAIMALMRNPMPVLLGTQTLLIQHFSSWLPELVSIMTPQEILELATNLLDSCTNAKGKMVLYKLIMIMNYSHLAVFRLPETRATLVSNTFRWLAPYWGATPVASEQWRDQARLCCSVVAAQMEFMGENSCQYVPKLTETFAILARQPRQPKRVFSMLFPTSYPFPTKPTAQEIEVDEATLEVSALLAAALTSEQKLILNPDEVDVTDILLQSLKVGQSVLSCQAFPRNWLSLVVSHHRYGMTALERIAEILIESLPDMYSDASEAYEFDTTIWRTFFDTLFIALSSPALAMETFPEQKRRAVWKIAGDVRELGAKLLRRSWESIGWEADAETKALHRFDKLGGYQVQFVPELVAPILELCLSVHASLRAVAIEVLRSMIVGAWQIDQDLSVIQTAMIDTFDKLCRTKSVTEAVLQKTFIPEMLQQFAPLQNSVEHDLYTAVVEMFNKIDDLLKMLASVHSSGTSTNEASRLVDTLHLMQFLKDVQSDEPYIRYVHQLAEMQISAGNVTEAGLALQMHADRYEWDPATNLSEIVDLKMPAQNAFERKEALYFRMCQHLEKGRSWKRALAAYRELASQYEFNVFDFSKLARAQRAIASIQENISRGDRALPRYFRVVYKGHGFPPTLRDKQFIFEGQPGDRLAMFEDRMQQLHPAAKILRAGSEAEVEGQYLQIFAVSPNKDIEHIVFQRTKVSQAVREYTLVGNPQKFATTSRHPAQDLPVTEQVVEKVIYTTAEEFPTILRRSEIVKVEILTLLPIEAAIERTTRKTQELLALEKRIGSGEDEGAMGRLTDDLMSSVDANSDSSVARYRGLLPIATMADDTSGDVTSSVFARGEPELDTSQSALKVALLDHALAIRRCLSLYRKPQHLPTKAELIPRFEATFQQELATLFPQKPAVFDDVTPRPSIEPFERVDTREQAAEGAAQEDQDAEKRQGRRRSSLPFLRRGSSRQGRTNGTNDESGRESRAGSRARDRSSSRLSFFRSTSDQDKNLKKERRESDAGDAGLGNLKKRLSFLNSSSARVGSGVETNGV